MTIYESIPYSFTTNVSDAEYTTYNPQTSEDGVYKGDGSKLTHDTRKLYYCSRDYSVQDKYKVNEHGHLFLKPDDIIFRDKKWYRVKQCIDLSLKKDGSYGFGGATDTLTYKKAEHIQRVEYKGISKNGDNAASTETKSAPIFSYERDGDPYTVEEHWTRREIVNGELIEFLVIYIVVPPAPDSENSEDWIEKSRTKVKTIASYPTQVIDVNYEQGDEFLIWHNTIDKWYTKVITTVAQLPSYNNTNYYEPLPMWTNICVEYDWLPSYRVISEDGKLYNIVEQDGNTIYELTTTKAFDGIFLGNILGYKIKLTYNNKIVEIENIGENVKFYKFELGITKVKVEIIGTKTGIGLILVGKGKVVGRTKENYTMHPNDTSIWKENKGGYIEYIEGMFVFDYESTIYEYKENRAYLLDVIKTIKRNLIGVDFNENSEERYSKAIGRLVVKDIIDRVEKENDEGSFGVEIPFILRSTT